MNTTIKMLAEAAALALFAGCFTISQTEFPSAQLARPAKDVKVAVEGFRATVFDYMPVYTTQTYVDGGYYVRGRGPYRRSRVRYVSPHVGAYTTETLVAQARETDVFLQRAMDALETAGFILRAAPADYTLSVAFAGPDEHPDAGWHFAETFLSLTFLFRSGEVWSAQLKIYDNKTGKCVFAQNYSQTFETHGWSPLPLFGFADYAPGRHSYMMNWCLDALTDRVCADATAFLAQRTK